MQIEVFANHVRFDADVTSVNRRSKRRYAIMMSGSTSADACTSFERRIAEGTSEVVDTRNY